MNRGKRPVPVTVLAWVYVGVGVIGFVYHLTDAVTRHSLEQDIVWAELTELLAILAGVYMLRGQNWARWLALAWMAFHVVLSAFHEIPELTIHTLFFAVIAWFLFRPAAALYFRVYELNPK